MIDTIESAIITRLESQIIDLTIKAFPSKPSDFKALPFNKGLILVAYSGSSFSEPTNKDTLIQEREVEISITLQIRDLRGHSGAYSYLEKIRTALSGFAPLGDLRVMFLGNEALMQVVDNVWVWGQTWQLTVRQA